jgi:hypothetical protein
MGTGRRTFTDMRARSAVVAVAALLALPLLPSGTSAATAAFAGGAVRGDLGPADASRPFSAASSALQTYGPTLGVEAETFRFDAVRTSPIGVHVRGRQIRGGLPIDGASAGVDIIGGRVRQVQARGTSLPGEPVAAAITGAAATEFALAASGVSEPAVAPSAERLLVARQGRLVDTWRVAVFSLTPAVAVTVDLDAASGALLAIRSDRVELDGTATVFDPNAVVELQDPTLREPGVDLIVDTDLDSPELTSALVTLPVREVDPQFLPAGRMLGPWVDVRGHGPLDADGTFEFTRGDPRFETPMAYTSLDRLQRYFQALGFTGGAGVNAEPQDVYTVRIEGFDNSFYMPSQDLIAFGTGGVDDAEDAEVILHEYGHAVQDAQVPGWGDTHEGGSMGEGFGDFLAGAYYAGSISEGFQDECIADWDATSYSSDDPPCLRRLDEDKHYPEDMEGGVHADGEIWSAFLWTLRSSLSTRGSGVLPVTTLDAPPTSARNLPESEVRTANIIKLVLLSHELLTPDAEFGDGVAALRMAAKALGRRDWARTVNMVAQTYGLPPS